MLGLYERVLRLLPIRKKGEFVGYNMLDMQGWI
jgi:hypothetical protein